MNLDRLINEDNERYNSILESNDLSNIDPFYAFLMNIFNLDHVILNDVVVHVDTKAVLDFGVLVEGFG